VDLPADQGRDENHVFLNVRAKRIHAARSVNCKRTKAFAALLLEPFRYRGEIVRVCLFAPFCKKVISPDGS